MGIMVHLDGDPASCCKLLPSNLLGYGAAMAALINKGIKSVF
jgi:hypothetical protein